MGASARQVATMDQSFIQMALHLFYQFITFAFVVIALLTAGCGEKKTITPQASEDISSIRPLTEAERLTDFDILAQSVRALYGPREFKERRFGYSLESLIQEYRSRVLLAKDDIEAYSIYAEFLARLRDGHVSIRSSLGAYAGAYYVPVFLTPVEGRVLIAEVSDESLKESHGIEVGDELLAVDGKKPFDYLPTILKYDAWGNDASDRHAIFRLLRRPAYMLDLKPTRPSVRLRIEKPDGRILERDLIWSYKAPPNQVPSHFTTPLKLNPTELPKPLVDFHSARLNSVLGSLLQFGREVPFFSSEAVENEFGIKRVKPSAEYLKKYGVEQPDQAPELYAAVYTYEEKNLLLVRLPSYDVENSALNIAWYKAVLDEYGASAQALIVDQTHNPGGKLHYATEFLSLFANSEKDANTRSLVNFLHADRKWMDDFGFVYSMGTQLNWPAELLNVLKLSYHLVEKAYDSGRQLTEEPIPLFDFNHINPSNFVFDKPVLLLIDELAGSCGDVVPLLMKENKMATLFGTRTMGLGGNVEDVITLPNTQATISLTRGLFAAHSPSGEYKFDELVENNGVTPDIAYQHTVQDVRAGYVGYVRAFSDAAIGLLATSPAE